MLMPFRIPSFIYSFMNAFRQRNYKLFYRFSLSWLKSDVCKVEKVKWENLRSMTPSDYCIVGWKDGVIGKEKGSQVESHSTMFSKKNCNRIVEYTKWLDLTISQIKYSTEYSQQTIPVLGLFYKLALFGSHFLNCRLKSIIQGNNY